MNKSRLKQIVGIGVIVATIAAFVWYFANNPSVWESIKSIPSGTLLILVGLYFVAIFALAFVTIATLKLCRLQIKLNESLLLTMYTAIVNFFGPLQSGPAFRGLYLKQKHGLSLKIYAASTSVYYLLWGLFSIMLLFSGVVKWGIIPILVIFIASLYLISRKTKLLNWKLIDMRPLLLLLVATAFQVFVISLIYYVEVHGVMPEVTYQQVLIYTGAANLALFVSLTPGAIGFREAFLIFSQKLHHIPTEAIVAANAIDRAVYFVILAILAIYIFGFHAANKLGVTSIRQK